MAVYNRGEVYVASTCFFVSTVISFIADFSPRVVISQPSVHSAGTFRVTNGAYTCTSQQHYLTSQSPTWRLRSSSSRRPRRHISNERETEMRERETLRFLVRTNPPGCSLWQKHPDHNNLVYVYPVCKIERCQKKTKKRPH